MTTPHPSVVGALRLRHWALGAFSGTPTPPPQVPDESWHLFLAREACALRLVRVVGSAAPPLLRDAADREAQNVLALRAELVELLALARKSGLSPIVLKGGAMLDDPARSVGAKDIDLLLDTDDGIRFAAILDASGWQPIARGGAGHHLAERFRPGCPPVEIHTVASEALNELGSGAVSRAIPHPHHPGARLLAPADQVAHVAIHQTAQHVSHRGRLRDLLLLADALGAGAVRADPRDWISGATALPALEQALTMARALAEGRTVTDHFAGIAVLWYRMDQTAPARPSRFHRNMMYWIYDLFVADGAATAHWQRSWGARAEERSSIAALRWLEHHVPPASALRAFARRLWLPPVVAAAWWKARRERAIAQVTIAALHPGR